MSDGHPCLLALTMGDPCGIGPEIVVRAVQLHDEREAALVVVGSVAVFRRTLRQLDLHLPVAQLCSLAQAPEAPPGTLAVWEPPGLPSGLENSPIGHIDAQAGEAAIACIVAAARAAMAGEVAAVVTAPVHKEALAAAGSPYPGHTEMLQALAAAPASAPPQVRMMLANDELRTVLVTIHMSLRQAIDELSLESVLSTIRIAHRAATSWGMSSPRIAVAGLNPHAGEGGLFGDEELRIIGPAVRRAQAEGIDASGPYAPDTVFMRARHAPPRHPGAFDLVIAMTHDHGLIPVKYLGVEHGVNVTLGLPFVRTSPDHGTAFDIAGQGRADPSSMRAAIRMARRLAEGTGQCRADEVISAS